MKKYELDCDNSNEIIKVIKNIILSKHPIVDDRMDLLMHNPAPAMDIDVDIYKDEKDNSFTNIMFLDGNNSSKTSIEERLNIKSLISTTTINGLIQFILNDHDIIRAIYKNKNGINILFVVDFREENMHGISCGSISLELDFYGYQNHNEILEEYFNSIVTTFNRQLVHTEWFKKGYKNYCIMTKAQLINSLSETDLHKFMSLLTNEDICNLLLDMPDDKFGEIYTELKNIQNDQKNLIKKIGNI